MEDRDTLNLQQKPTITYAINHKIKVKSNQMIFYLIQNASSVRMSLFVSNLCHTNDGPHAHATCRAADKIR